MSDSTPKDTLEEVLERLRDAQVDPEIWRQAYLSLWPFVMATNFRLLGGNTQLAEEASQDVLIRLFRYGRLGSLKSANASRAYIRAVCRNVVRSYLRRSNAEAHATESFDDSRHESFSKQPSSDEEAVANDLKEYLAAGLGESDRRLLELTVAGYGLPEISKSFGISYSAAAVRLHRLRSRVHKLLYYTDLDDAV
jgi:RNA polymerase sigma factor (sigma-70 family)